MQVFWLERWAGAGLRRGFTVGKMLGGAVQRYRMKRRLREAVRLEAAWPGPAADVVINPKKSGIAADFAILRSEISRAFEVIQKSANRRIEDRGWGESEEGTGP